MTAGLLLAWLAFSTSQAALASPAAPSAHAAATSGLAAPRQLSPADDARVSTIPGFSWRPVRHAAKYEFQLAADRAFKSIVDKGSFQTLNTFASIDTAVADSDYYWRVRAIDSRDRAGRWSAVRSLAKRWTTAPQLRGPVNGATVSYPSTPLVLRWESVPFAYKYRVQVATDPSLARSVLGDKAIGVETSGTSFAPQGTLAPGRYYWAVTPLDAEKHPGTRSPVGSFDWSWPTTTAARVTDVDADPRVFDPQFSWDPIAGAAQYEVEINPSDDFAVGSRVCCDERAAGTSLSPQRLLPNNTYYWRVRAIDVDGNAGDWNIGPSFRKDFDAVTATISNLRVRDNVADRTPAVGASGLPETDAPVVAWDPVAGASSYEVIVAPWEGFCNWTATTAGKPMARTVTTATTAWTPLALTTKRPVGNAFPTVANESWTLWDGTSYCVRVRARSDRDANGKEIVSDWTQIGGVGNRAFTYRERPQPCTAAATPASAYHEPQAGSVSSRMPLFTWDWVDGACGYFVVVARDADFTKIVDVAFTRHPAYAPRTGTGPTTYADETTSYYWAVMPSAYANGDGVSTQPQEDNPQAFEKRSVAPQLLSPAGGADVAGQPTFRWTRAEAAREYRLQVDDDPTFGSPISDLVTNSTAYTSTAALPADTVLYWRVRANDENKVGLTWSPTGTFRRRLPVPALASDSPLGGEAIPVLSWSPVEGAVSYDMHVEQVDGTKRDFNMRSTAFTPVIFYGTGVWRWQARANFKSGSRVVSGGYSGLAPFTRRIATPTGLRTTKSGSHALLSWSSALMAKQYRVQISTTDSFSKLIEQATTDHTSWAPKMTNPAFRSGEPLYWRVAVIDEGNNVGGYATAALRAPKPLKMKVRGNLRRGRTATVAVTLTSGGKRVSGASVSIQGPVRSAKARRSGRRGTVRLRVRVTKKGTVRFTAAKRGYETATATLRVR